VNRRIYLDSCIWIYLVEGLADLHEAVQRRLAEVREETLCYSSMTLLECRVQPLRDGDEDLLAIYDEIFTSRNVLHLPIGASTFLQATELRARHGIRTPDALHLAAAVEGGCDELWTNDQRLAAAGGNRIAFEIIP